MIMNSGRFWFVYKRPRMLWHNGLIGYQSLDRDAHDATTMLSPAANGSDDGDKDGVFI